MDGFKTEGIHTRCFTWGFRDASEFELASCDEAGESAGVDEVTRAENLRGNIMIRSRRMWQVRNIPSKPRRTRSSSKRLHPCWSAHKILQIHVGCSTTTVWSSVARMLSGVGKSSRAPAQATLWQCTSFLLCRGQGSIISNAEESIHLALHRRATVRIPPHRSAK